jgi:hypothetical protein
MQRVFKIPPDDYVLTQGNYTKGLFLNLWGIGILGIR